VEPSAPPKAAPRPAERQRPPAGAPSGSPAAVKPVAPAPPEATPRPAERQPAPSGSPAAEKPRPAPAARPAPTPAPAKPAKIERLAWFFPQETPPDTVPSPIANAAAVDSAGRIFLHQHERLVALVEENGQPKVLWEYVTGHRAPGPVVVGPQDTLRLHCADGYLHAVEAATGKQPWPPACVGEPLGYAQPVVDQEGNTWISAADGGLLHVDPRGRLQKPGRYFRSRQKLNAAGILSGGILYIGSEEGYMLAIEMGPERGTACWDQQSERGYVGALRSAPARTADGVLVVVGADDRLVGIAASGTILWKTQMPGQMLGAPVFDRFGHIYIGVSQAPRGRRPGGLLLCLDGNSHKIRWEYQAAGPVESTPVIGQDDVIYFGDNTGVLHAVNFHGRKLWTSQLGSPVRSAGTIVGPHRLAFGLDNERLVVLECTSEGLAAEGWPKIGCTLGQSGLV
jgi:outer membrane protein assembly factor BamB